MLTNVFFSKNMTQKKGFPVTFAMHFCRFFNNAYYGRVGGISTREMNMLELDLLFSLDFRLKVNLETFRSYCLQLEKEALALVLERPIQVQATKGTKPLICNGSVDETCKHELVREKYSSQALQRCSW